jgi:hypothetical protein
MEPFLHYFEDQEEFLLYLNKTVTNATPSRKLKMMPRLFRYSKSNDITCYWEEMWRVTWNPLPNFKCNGSVTVRNGVTL